MHHIKPLSALTTGEIHDLGQAAAERGEPASEASPFAHDEPKHAEFMSAYRHRQRELRIADSCAA